jgi:hypothetical protein
MHTLLGIMSATITGGSLFFMYSGQPAKAIFMLLLGIFLMLVQILVALYRK